MWKLKLRPKNDAITRSKFAQQYQHPCNLLNVLKSLQLACRKWTYLLSRGEQLQQCRLSLLRSHHPSALWMWEEENQWRVSLVKAFSRTRLRGRLLQMSNSNLRSRPWEIMRSTLKCLKGRLRLNKSNHQVLDWKVGQNGSQPRQPYRLINLIAETMDNVHHQKLEYLRVNKYKSSQIQKTQIHLLEEQKQM